MKKKRLLVQLIPLKKNRNPRVTQIHDHLASNVQYSNAIDKHFPLTRHNILSHFCDSHIMTRQKDMIKARFGIKVQTGRWRERTACEEMEYQNDTLDKKLLQWQGVMASGGSALRIRKQLLQ